MLPQKFETRINNIVLRVWQFCPYYLQQPSPAMQSLVDISDSPVFQTKATTTSRSCTEMLIPGAPVPLSFNQVNYYHIKKCYLVTYHLKFRVNIKSANSIKIKKNGLVVLYISSLMRCQSFILPSFGCWWIMVDWHNPHEKMKTMIPAHTHFQLDKNSLSAIVKRSTRSSRN